MSTEIATFEGESIPNTKNKIYLTAFYGGDKRGQCVQFTIDRADGVVVYTQLPRKKARKLAYKILKATK